MQYKGMELCDFCFSPVLHGEPCGACGFTHENYKYLYNKILFPGAIILGKYIIGRVLKKDETKTAYLAYTSASERVVITEYLPSAIVQRSNGEEMVSVIPDKKGEFFEGAKEFVESADEMRKSGKDVSEAFYTNGTVYFCTRYEKAEKNSNISEKASDMNPETVQLAETDETVVSRASANVTPETQEANPVYADNSQSFAEQNIIINTPEPEAQNGGYDIRHNVEYTSTDGDIGKSHYEAERIAESVPEPPVNIANIPTAEMEYPKTNQQYGTPIPNEVMYENYYPVQPVKAKKKWLFPTFMIIGGVVCAALIAVIIFLILKGNDNSGGDTNDNSQLYHQSGYNNQNTGNVNQANEENNITANEPTGEIVNTTVDTNTDVNAIISDAAENIENIVGEALKDVVVK